MRKIAILQPNYIPWKGVFDLINKVDVFVFYDDVQYTVKDWRNRNKIKTPNGDLWLTVPVIHKGRRDQLIKDAEIDNSTNWQDSHYKSMVSNYKKTPFFQEYHFLLEELYLNKNWDNISDLDIFATKRIAEVLGIDVEWYQSSDLGCEGTKEGGKVVQICNELNCNYFINGPASREFMDEELFQREGIVLDYIKYNYPEYNQLYPPFNHYVSVLDVLFHCGDKAKSYICGSSNEKFN